MWTDASFIGACCVYMQRGARPRSARSVCIIHTYSSNPIISDGAYSKLFLRVTEQRYSKNICQGFKGLTSYALQQLIKSSCHPVNLITSGTQTDSSGQITIFLNLPHRFGADTKGPDERWTGAHHDALSADLVPSGSV